MVTVVRAASDGSETLIDPETSPPIARSTRSDFGSEPIVGRADAGVLQRRHRGREERATATGP